MKTKYNNPIVRDGPQKFHVEIVGEELNIQSKFYNTKIISFLTIKHAILL